MTRSCPAEDQLLAAAAGESDAVEILRHVEACPACRRMLERLRAELAALRSFSGEFDRSRSPTLDAAGTSKPTAVATRARPASIGRYVVLDELGSGGQARVYRVVDPELGRPLVLKLSRQPGGEGEVRRDAVLAEGRLLAELDHPG
ncbi:MAG TPA: hypothetical protein VGX76_21160, partial [Pirellulales bacterium]|nr:hypothetical protein [Pirellulales bacterium]